MGARDPGTAQARSFPGGHPGAARVSGGGPPSELCRATSLLPPQAALWPSQDSHRTPASSSERSSVGCRTPGNQMQRHAIWRGPTTGLPTSPVVSPCSHQAPVLGILSKAFPQPPPRAFCFRLLLLICFLRNADAFLHECPFIAVSKQLHPTELPMVVPSGMFQQPGQCVHSPRLSLLVSPDCSATEEEVKARPRGPA